MSAELNTTTEILTVAEARSRMPQVKRLVQRMIDITCDARRIRRDAATTRPSPESGREPLVARLQALQADLQETVRALNEQGAVVKDPERGLIDFYSWHEDEIVLLCWLHGEDTVEYWHGMHEGFSGRKSIDGDDVG